MIVLKVSAQTRDETLLWSKTIMSSAGGGAGPLVRCPEHQELTFAASPRRFDSCKR